MSKVIILIFLLFSSVVNCQIAITFSDEFNLVDFPQYDNLTYQDETFFVLPLSLNEFIAVQSMDFNISYNPQIIEPLVDFFELVNSPNFTTPLNVSNALVGIAGTINAESFNVSADSEMLTISYSNSISITQEQFDDNGEILMYLPFKKLDACSKSPFNVNFWDGNSGDSYVNPNQTNAIIVNQSLSQESGNIYTQDAVVSFNILSVNVEQIGNAFHPTISGGTPPFSFEWTDKMDVVLSTDSIYYPPSPTDYLLYVNDANLCQAILFLTFDQTASIEELQKKPLIYPNPAANYINVKTDKALNYQLLDLSGRPLREGRISTGTYAIERHQLPSGTYLLILKTERVKETFLLTFL